MVKRAKSKNVGAMRALQAIEAKANRLPSPQSRVVPGVNGGKPVNVCPACGAPCSSFPWSCGACGWTAADRPELCTCQCVHLVEEDADGYSYDVSADYAECDRLTGLERAAWASARSAAVDVPDPRGEP